MSPSISIIIPTYNHKKSLEKCLVSIAVQTFRDFEVIVVDDGSTDGTADFLVNYELGIRNNGRHPFHNSFFIIHDSENRGANTARNVGLKQARGTFLLFCDADVVMRPDMLERMMRTLADNADASYAYSSFKFGWKTFKLWAFNEEKLKQMPYVHSTSLIRRAHIPKGGWDESLKRLQDWDLFLTMLEEGHHGAWIPDILFTITVRRGGYSQWLPSFAYRFPFLPSVKKFKAAEAIVKKKHQL